MQESLLQTLREGEFVRTTQRVNFGTGVGGRYYTEADPLDGEQAVGMLTRGDADPTFAWLIGKRPSFELEILEPVERALVLRMARGIDGMQKVTIFFNQTKLATHELKGEVSFQPLRLIVPADIQRRGVNRVSLRFDRQEMIALPGELRPLPVAARIVGALFLDLPLEERLSEGARLGRQPRAALATVTRASGMSTMLIVPAGSSARIATRLPEASRVVLNVSVERIETDLDISLIDLRGQRHRLLALGQEASVPREARVDLTRWAGQPVKFDFWGRAGEGAAESQVTLGRLGLLVPEEELTGDPFGTRAVEDAEDGGVLVVDEVAPPAAPSATSNLPAGTLRDGTPSFLVIVLDSLARRHCSVYGAPRTTTPVLDALAERGVRVEHVTSPASDTRAAVGSLLTGVDPLHHAFEQPAQENGELRLSHALPRLARRLQRAGWRTSALVAHPDVGAAVGLELGFDRYDELFAESGLNSADVDGTRLAPQLAVHLEAAAGSPFFTFVHVFEPHAPYAAPDDLTAQFVRQPYQGDADGSRQQWLDDLRAGRVSAGAADWGHLKEQYQARVALADRIVGQLLAALDAAGRADDTVVVVTSAHGEAFGQHGIGEHGDHVYWEQLDVPLVLAGPGVDSGVVDGRASLLDVAPTVLALAGVPVPPDMQGVDLLAGPLPTDRTLFARSASELPALSWSRGRWRLIVDTRTRRRMLFDTSTDRGEKIDLFGTHVVLASLMYQELTRAVTAASLGETSDDEPATAAETLQQLVKIGYMGGAGDQGLPLGEQVMETLRSLLNRQDN